MTTRKTLPPQTDQIYLTDGGLETTLIFHDGYELPYFAAFDLLKDKQGRNAIRKYFETYAAIAVNAKTGFILESPTWRSSHDWAAKLGYDKERLRRVNEQAISLMSELRAAFELPTSPFIISGCVGPRGDGYVVEDRMTIEEAKAYHSEQIETFANTEADIISALTMTYPEEAIGITLAAREAGIPVSIAFTVELDGRLPCGISLKDAIEQVDRETQAGPAYYMINCAHPDHFQAVLSQTESWMKRICGIRANASRMSHEELDEAEELDAGDPKELGAIYKRLVQTYPQFNVLGGCCGTDHRHIGEISLNCSC